MLHKLKSLSGVFINLILLFTFAGCHQYYMATTRNVRDHLDKSLDSLKNQNRYFVLRTPNHAYYMGNMELNPDRKTLSCTLDTLSPGHTTYVKNGKRNMKYKDGAVLSEVHLYIPEDINPGSEHYTLRLDQIQKIEVIEKDKKGTTNSYVIGAVGYTFGALAVAAVIIAATKSSCPFVSAYDGNQFALQGEIYGGAIYPQLVRHDYLPLKMARAPNGNLQLKISNELQEKQFTDMAELIVIKHSKNTKILADAEGNLYNIHQPQSPAVALLSNKKDVKNLLLNADNRLMYFDDSTAVDGRNEVALKFNKEEKNKKGKLILTLKNSYWLDYLYGEMAKEFGSYYNTYAAQQHKKPAAQINKWMRAQHIPLEVSIKINGDWQTIANITTIGPVATRDIVIPVDLSLIKSAEVEIKLSSGYLFWELDYAAIDYTSDQAMDVKLLMPFTAHDETGKDVLNLLTKEDNEYLEQPVPGTVATLEYMWQPVKGSDEAYTFILHTKGYYEHVRSFTGPPNRKFLLQFKKPGAFPQFSLQRYKQFNKEQIRYLSKN